MIETIRNSDFDNEKLFHIFIPKNSKLENFDFSKVVVKKPWGYEYLLYEDNKTSVWTLHLNRNSLTSMHCHIYKKTALIVLAGEVVCATLNKGLKLKEGDAVILDKKVFHSTQAITNDGAIILEVETPSLKADVVRLADSYGRESLGYETPDEMNYDIRNCEYQFFKNDEMNIIKRVGNMNVSLEKLKEESKIENGEERLIIILEGEIKNVKNKESHIVGDIVKIDKTTDFIAKKDLKLMKFFKIDDIAKY